MSREGGKSETHDEQEMDLDDNSSNPSIVNINDNGAESTHLGSPPVHVERSLSEELTVSPQINFTTPPLKTSLGTAIEERRKGISRAQAQDAARARSFVESPYNIQQPRFPPSTPENFVMKNGPDPHNPERYRPGPYGCCTHCSKPVLSRDGAIECFLRADWIHTDFDCSQANPETIATLRNKQASVP